MKNIVWIASYPKSGNTWIRSIIALGIFGKLDLNKLGLQIASFSNCIKNIIEINKKLTQKGDIRNFWDEAQKKICHNLNKNKVFLKTHNLAARYDTINFPNESYSHKAIYVIRDPRDVSISYSHHFNVSLNEAIHSLLNEGRFLLNDEDYSKNEFLSSWGNHVNSWKLCKFPVLFIKYEDLISNPKEICSKIFNFLKISPIISIDKILSETNFDNLSKLEKKEGFIEATDKSPFFRQGRSEIWKNEKPHIFKPLVDKFEDTMKLFKYI